MKVDAIHVVSSVLLFAIGFATPIAVGSRSDARVSELYRRELDTHCWDARNSARRAVEQLEEPHAYMSLTLKHIVDDARRREPMRRRCAIAPLPDIPPHPSLEAMRMYLHTAIDRMRSVAEPARQEDAP